MFCLFYYIIFQFYSGVKVFYVLSVNIPNFYRYYSQSGPVLRGLTNLVYHIAQKVSISAQFIIFSFLTNSVSKAHNLLVLYDLMYTNCIKQDDIFMIFVVFFHMLSTIIGFVQNNWTLRMHHAQMPPLFLLDCSPIIGYNKN